MGSCVNLMEFLSVELWRWNLSVNLSDCYWILFCSTPFSAHITSITSDYCSASIFLWISGIKDRCGKDAIVSVSLLDQILLEQKVAYLWGSIILKAKHNSLFYKAWTVDYCVHYVLWMMLGLHSKSIFGPMDTLCSSRSYTFADNYFYFDIHSGVGWLFYHFLFRGRTLLREWLIDRYSLHVFIREAKGAAHSLCNYKFMRNMKVCLHKTFLLVVWCYRYKYWWSIGLHGVIISHQWFSVQSTYTTGAITQNDQLIGSSD